MTFLNAKRVLVTGGTGSLGQALVRRILSGEEGQPSRVTVLSRDEAKQHEMRLAYAQQPQATDDIIYAAARDALAFHVGDVRDYDALRWAVAEADVIVHAAALKQVPTCEYFPEEAFRTNAGGAANLARAVREAGNVEVVVGVSTDKACKPVNVMGMTKALSERILVEANRHAPNTRLVCVRYGNVLASRGSIIPLFQEQAARGGPLTVTVPEMTRFLLSLDDAVSVVFAAMKHAAAGEIIVPKLESARIVDVARAIIGDRPAAVEYTGIRPGEKVHEVLVSEEELPRTTERNGFFAIGSVLEPPPEGAPALREEYSSRNPTLEGERLRAVLAPFLSDGGAE